MDHHHSHSNQEQKPLFHDDDDDDNQDSTLNRAYAATNAFFAILGEWLILIITCSIALLFFPLAPSFTLNSTSSSVVTVTGDNRFAADLDVGLLLEDSNPMGSTIYYDSLRVSLFHREELLSSFSLHVPFHQNEEPSKTAIEAKFNNVSLKVDEWGSDHGTHGSSCGYVYLNLWFSASARYIQPIWPAIWDKIQGNCGELKVELCSSSSSSLGTIVVQSFLASCDVYSDLVYKVRLVLFVMLFFFIVTALAVPFIVEQFFCSETFSASFES